MCLDHVIAVVWLEGSLSEGLSRLSSDNPASESQAMLPADFLVTKTRCFLPSKVKSKRPPRKPTYPTLQDPRVAKASPPLQNTMGA